MIVIVPARTLPAVPEPTRYREVEKFSKEVCINACTKILFFHMYGFRYGYIIVYQTKVFFTGAFDAPHAFL
jgi:hypothetical protein